MSQSQGSIELMHLMGSTVTRHEKLACVERELALRRKIYMRMVRDGHMTPHMAAHEIRVMEAIVEDYRSVN